MFKKIGLIAIGVSAIALGYLVKRELDKEKKAEIVSKISKLNPIEEFDDFFDELDEELEDDLNFINV